MPSSSSIRAYVDWEKSAVFAGEDVNCIITFTNTAPVHARDSHESIAPQAHGSSSYSHDSHGINKTEAPYRAQSPSITGQPHSIQTPERKIYRQTVSLNTTESTQNGSSPSREVENTMRNRKDGHNHQRSLSITSMGVGSQKGSGSRVASQIADSRRNHGRSASLQTVPQSSGASPNVRNSKFLSVEKSLSPYAQPAAYFEQHSILSSSRRRSSAMLSQAGALGSPITTRTASASFSSDFKFPVAPSPSRSPSSDASRGGLFYHVEEEISTSKSVIEPPLRISRKADNAMVEELSKIENESNDTGTARSSGDLYSLRNPSFETLASENPHHIVKNAAVKSTPNRRLSHRHAQSRKQPESVMMGYAHVQGSFTLDGSLVNQNSFEDVKRKGVVGSHGGGGVIGVEKSKAENGLLGSIGLGSIGESLGGLLGGIEPSSMREMRGIAKSKTVPLISTPQSILFVDLRLNPGESRSYSFSFTLPVGLPPTYKGRVIKVIYNLVLGTQRAGSTAGQQVKQVEVPFRVLGSVNGRGEVLGHDLMSPYIILKDLARSASIMGALENGSSAFTSFENQLNAKKGSLGDFMNYVKDLQEPRHDKHNEPLLSPSASTSKDFYLAELSRSMEETIEFAISQSHLKTVGQHSANRFEIARAGRRVAVVKLARPAFRLGESVFGVIDFEGAQIHSSCIFVTLETSEVVDPAIALRSASSIYRATRKIHATHAENTLYCQQTSFTLEIQPNSTPQFVTSGINMEWKLKVEFITSRVDDNNTETTNNSLNLLEEVANDERGIILAGVETLSCDSFEIAIPITVYGAIAEIATNNTSEGLIV